MQTKEEPKGFGRLYHRNDNAPPIDFSAPPTFEKLGLKHDYYHLPFNTNVPYDELDKELSNIVSMYEPYANHNNIRGIQKGDLLTLDFPHKAGLAKSLTVLYMLLPREFAKKEVRVKFSNTKHFKLAVIDTVAAIENPGLCEQDPAWYYWELGFLPFKEWRIHFD